MWQEEPKEENTRKQVDSLRLFINYHMHLRMLRRIHNHEAHPQHELKKKKNPLFVKHELYYSKLLKPNVKFILVKRQRKKHPTDYVCLHFTISLQKSSSQVSADWILNANTIVKIQMCLNNVGHKYLTSI